MLSKGFPRSASACMHHWERYSPNKSAMDSNRKDDLERKRIATLSIYETLCSENMDATHNSILIKTASEMQQYGYSMNRDHVRYLLRKAQPPRTKRNLIPWTNEEVGILRSTYIEEDMAGKTSNPGKVQKSSNQLASSRVKRQSPRKSN
jgi:hypothetical protein